MNDMPQVERRQHHRLRVHPMYTSVRAVPHDGNGREAGYDLSGHVYDISASGIRIELDEPLDVGGNVELSVMLPGAYRDFNARANVVWVHGDEDDPGPRRMALQFTGFESSSDQVQLERFLEPAFGRIAA